MNLSGRCWWQYRLQNFGNYLKLFPLFFLLLQTLLPSPCHARSRFDSFTVTKAVPCLMRYLSKRLALHARNSISGFFLCTWHHFFEYFAISLCTCFFRQLQANECSSEFKIKVNLYRVCSDKIIEKEPQCMEAFTMNSQHFAGKLEIRDRSIRYDINHPTLYP